MPAFQYVKAWHGAALGEKRPRGKERAQWQSENPKSIGRGGLSWMGRSVASGPGPRLLGEIWVE